MKSEILTAKLNSRHDYNIQFTHNNIYDANLILFINNKTNNTKYV